MIEKPHFKRLALIGFGLIGGSIARAARGQDLVGEIIATARTERTRARVRELGIVDSVAELALRKAKEHTGELKEYRWSAFLAGQPGSASSDAVSVPKSAIKG